MAQSTHFCIDDETVYMMFKNTIPKYDKVFAAGNPGTAFEDIYILVRRKEGRIYTEEELSALPDLPKSHNHAKEWKLRSKSAKRFTKYLLNQRKSLTLLEIGCGNGWFTNYCAPHTKHAVGIDVNLSELRQAAEIFRRPNLSYGYWDLFTDSPFTEIFDIIVLNAVIQYFKDVPALISRLSQLGSRGSEIHILDSPFYAPVEIVAATYRTEKYYKQLGYPQMAGYYFHHSVEDISGFEMLYNPPKNKLLRALKGNDMPFGWYRLIL